MSDRIAIMRGGRLEQYGTAEDLYERPATRFVAEFVGEATLLPARVESAGPDALVVRLGSGVALRAQPRPGLVPGGSATVVLRPEKLRLVESAGGVNGFSGVVADVLYLGDAMKYWVRTEQGTTLIVRSQSRFDAIRCGKGDPVHLGVDPRDVVVVPD